MTFRSASSRTTRRSATPWQLPYPVSDPATRADSPFVGAPNTEPVVPGSAGPHDPQRCGRLPHPWRSLEHGVDSPTVGVWHSPLMGGTSERGPENFNFWSKALKTGRFIEENLFFRMVPSFCLGRLLQVKIALCHIRSGSSVRHICLGQRYYTFMRRRAVNAPPAPSAWRSSKLYFSRLWCPEICALKWPTFRVGPWSRDRASPLGCWLDFVSRPHAVLLRLSQSCSSGRTRLFA